MTSVMPSPIPLDMPPGDPEALADLIQDVAGAAFWFAVLGGHLAGPAASAPGWLGADAAAAATQVGTVATLARDAYDAVLRAAGRLRAHSERVEEVRRRVRDLESEQREDFTGAWARLHRLEHSEWLVRSGSPEAYAIVGELEASESARRRQHAALLEDLADDGDATARVLSECCAVVGGRGAPGDAGRVLAHLAVQLPGWGDPELARRGYALADVLRGRFDRDLELLVEEAAVHAGSPAFAAAFLSGLGVDGVRALLQMLGEGAFGDDMLGQTSAMARLLATALGAAGAAPVRRDPLEDVLTGSYVDLDGVTNEPDLVALGIAAVLAASTRAVRPSGPTLAAWGRQVLARERVLGEGAAQRVFREVLDPEIVDRFDVVPLIVEFLGDGRDPGAAADLLAGRHVWDALLARAWDDDGAALGRLVDTAAGAEGPTGDEAVRGGLEALGSGLADHDPDDWTVHRDTAAAVSPAIGEAVARHVSVATDALHAGASGPADGAVGDVLRGLGYLTLDGGAAAAVERALMTWARAQPVDLSAITTCEPLAVVAVPSAYVAVREYGQRLEFALHGFEEQQAAARREFVWNVTVGLGTEFLPGPFGVVGGLVEGYVAILLGMDGTWDNGEDGGLRLEQDDAEAAAREGLPPDAQAEAESVTAWARVAFDRTAGALGDPVPPASPETDWVGPLLDVLVPGPDDPAKRLRAGVPPPSGHR